MPVTVTLARASEKVFEVAIVATRCIVTVIPIEAAARPLDTSGARSAMPVAITLARTSEKVFGVGNVHINWLA
jgi:hypothetical protein